MVTKQFKGLTKRYDNLGLDVDVMNSINENANKKYSTLKELINSKIYNDSFTVLLDESLYNLLENLRGMEPDESLQRICNQSGNVIEFLYLKKEELFVMVLGYR